VLAAITAVHGGAGPWVVAGDRMGRYALAKLGLPRGSFDLEVVHRSPHEVQYSCIADGAAAATGASLGRVSLTLANAPAPDTRTTYRKRSTGEELMLQTTSGSVNRYKDVPRSPLMVAGREVLHLADAEIFQEVTTAVESAKKNESLRIRKARDLDRRRQDSVASSAQTAISVPHSSSTHVQVRIA
jgi:hypothetical protein